MNNCDPCSSASTLTVLSDNGRYTFFAVYFVISFASVLCNIIAISSIIKRDVRFIQKTCIVFLGCCDIFSTCIIALNNMETFSHTIPVWTLGEFFCSFIPLAQIAGVTASSIALMFIALDCYWSVMSAMNKNRRLQRPKICILVCLLTVTVSFLLGVPMAHFYTLIELTVLYSHRNETGHMVFDGAHLETMCVSFRKDDIRIYYCVMVVVIFLPLCVTFIWSYYKIAHLVWAHRKPIDGGGIKSSEDVRVGRKIRTFKIIVTLMLVFIILRFPYFLGMIFNLSMPNENHGKWPYFYRYVTAGLHIVNCGLNPFLYTFLNQTTNFLNCVRNFIRDICCFFCSKNEFEEFEHQGPLNPFIVDGVNRVKFGEVNVQEYQVEKY